MDFAADMNELSIDEAKRVYDEIGTAATGLRHLPYSSLRKTESHRFGCLRLWPKLKNFKDTIKLDTLKYRPLVSYERHRWRRVLSLLSQF